MKKNFGTRLLCAFLFLLLSGVVAFSIYSLSAEDGTQSNARSEVVTEKIKEEINATLSTTENGLKISEKIKYYVILHSPYGSDWNSNIRKLAHFSIYAGLGAMIYITLAILGANKFVRLLMAVVLCFGFACADEFHQSFTGRTASIDDVFLDTFGALVSCSILTLISIFYSCVFWIVRKVRKSDNQIEDKQAVYAK